MICSCAYPIPGHSDAFLLSFQGMAIVPNDTEEAVAIALSHDQGLPLAIQRGFSQTMVIIFSLDRLTPHLKAHMISLSCSLIRSNSVQ